MAKKKAKDFFTLFYLMIQPKGGSVLKKHTSIYTERRGSAFD
jgi:hypothetical protein